VDRTIVHLRSDNPDELKIETPFRKQIAVNRSGMNFNIPEARTNANPDI